MATHLPHGLQKLLEFTVGMPWPEGDEHEMWKLADSWRTFADELEQLASDLGVEAGAFGDAIQGEAGEQLQKYLRESLGGSADQMKDGAEQLAKALQNGGADIQKTKIMVIGMLAILAATLASLFASLFGSIFAPSVIAAARVGIGVLLRALVKKMMDAGIAAMLRHMALKVFTNAAIGTAFMVGLDAGIQGGQIAFGKRDGFDKESLKGSAIGGAIGGGLSGLAEGFGGLIGKFGGNTLSHLPRGLTGTIKPLVNSGLQIAAAAASNPLTNVATHSSDGRRNSTYLTSYTRPRSRAASGP